MKTYTDCKNRVWNLSVDIRSAKRVKDLAGVDLLDIGEGKLFSTLLSDPFTLANVLFALVKPQADAQNVSDEEFAEGLSGEALEHATDALLEALLDFFPPQKRKTLADALATLRKIEARLIQEAQTRLESPELAAQIEAAVQEVVSHFGTPSGSALQSAT